MTKWLREKCRHIAICWRPVVVITVIQALLVAQVRGDEPAKIELDKDSAWVGEPVGLSITLFSVGPFDGTAGFEFPELPQTVIQKVGSPVVGSQQVGQETLLTQRHKFQVVTRQSGSITIPAVSVRYRAKPSYDSPAQEFRQTTAPVTFESKVPPGSEGLGFVAAANSMQIEERWSPADIETLKPGDVIQRTITRSATGTMSMLLPDISQQTVAGVRHYSPAPTLEDKSNRGQISSKRIDVLKYQFEQAGTFEVPAETFVWWNSSDELLLEKTLPGRTFVVTNPPNAQLGEEQQEVSANGNWFYRGAIVASLSLAVGGVIAFLAIRRQRLHREARQPDGGGQEQEDAAARAVLAACKANEPLKAYAASTLWLRVVGESQASVGSGLDREMHKLAGVCFDVHSNPSTWDGNELAAAFRIARRQSKKGRARLAPPPAGLPPLNPT